MTKEPQRTREIEKVILRDLDSLRDFFLQSEAAIFDLYKRRNDMRRNPPPTLNQEDRLRMLEWATEQCKLLREDFLTMLRHSIFVGVMGHIEKMIDDVCEQARKTRGETLPVSDWKGNGIKRSIDYLVKVCRLNIPQGGGTHTWHLAMFQKMRNAIVHTRGILERKKDRKALESYCKKVDHFHITEDNKVLLGEQSLLAVVVHAKALIQSICGQLEE